MSLVKIANACAVECERQQVGLQELEYLLHAYRFVEDIGMNSVNLFKAVGSLVEPQKNKHGFRITPVTFQNGGSSCNPQMIYEQMEKLVENIRAFQTDPPLNIVPESLGLGADRWVKALTKQFLWIHPFADGNGRVGFLLYNYLLGTLDDPQPLPDFNW